MTALEKFTHFCKLLPAGVTFPFLFRRVNFFWCRTARSGIQSELMTSCSHLIWGCFWAHSREVRHYSWASCFLVPSWWAVLPVTKSSARSSDCRIGLFEVRLLHRSSCLLNLYFRLQLYVLGCPRKVLCCGEPFMLFKSTKKRRKYEQASWVSQRCSLLFQFLALPMCRKLEQEKLFPTQSKSRLTEKRSVGSCFVSEHLLYWLIFQALV